MGVRWRSATEQRTISGQAILGRVPRGVYSKFETGLINYRYVELGDRTRACASG
jgi:hypothetical protein